MLLDREFHLENYDGRIFTSYVSMVVDKHEHSRRNVLFSVIHTFQYNESDPCQNITKATGSSHNQPKKHSMSSNNHPYNYQWQQIWT